MLIARHLSFETIRDNQCIQSVTEAAVKDAHSSYNID
jgi:hypothetical protein